MGTQVGNRAPADILNGKPPPLETGDRLTSDEFLRRYEAMPELKKAELINGVVYVASPVRLRQHASPHADLVTWLGSYRAYTAGVLTGDNATARLDLANVPQPDVLLLIDPAYGGQARITKQGYIEGAPELVAEVAASSASSDLHDKLAVYRRTGVREYLVWRVLDRELDWFILRGRNYRRVKPGADSLLRSQVIPGLWLDASALIAGDLARVLAVVGQGTASPQHAAFVSRLRKASSKS